MRIILKRKAHLSFSLLFTFFLFSCASSGDSSFGDSPCTDCGERGEMALEIQKEKFYREWNPEAFARLDSTAILGTFPALTLIADAPEDCDFCHSFSAEAVDFDLASIEDSLWSKAFPKMQRYLMMPGMQVPEADSLYADSLMKELMKLEFVDGKPLESLEPWKSRIGTEQVLVRKTPIKIKTLLSEMASRYRVRYLSIPILLQVKIFPDLGKKGGFSYETLWTFWDARYGELVFLCYSEFLAESKNRVAPERGWGEPFAKRLWKMFSTDLSSVESH